VRTIDFDDDEAYVGNRPRTQVILHGPGGPHGTTFVFAGALVDTGADYATFPLDAAEAVGLDPSSDGQAITVSTAAGPATFWLLDVDIDVLGQTKTVPALFETNAPALFGRQAIFRFVDSAGFTTVDWLQDW
jgi:predicted aspartyl protease